jgi:NAD(P)-dependent dehydrogenase (short-subunit alcohol dehydrogenase family)
MNAGAGPAERPLAGKVIAITGATSGIGEVAALELARRGARLVIVARDAARAEALLARLQAGNHVLHLADLSLLSQQRSVAAAILAAEPRIDVLVNNAGAVFMGAARTADGLAPSFALNHLAYYTLTLALLPALRAAPVARIVSTASAAHRYARVPAPGFGLEDLQRDGIRGYALSKLCNLWFTRALAQRLAGTGMTAHALHPGFVATRFADNTPWPWNALMALRKRLQGRTPQQGAATLLALAAGELGQGASGRYFADGLAADPAPAALDGVLAERLWMLTAALTGLDLPTAP